MSATKLGNKIANKKVKVAVIGLGYVGLPIALEFVKRGFFVYGLDNNKYRVDNLIRGESYITDISSAIIKQAYRSRRFLPTVNASALADSDVVIVCVPTPLRKRKIPNISYIIKASRTIAKYLHRGQLIILESTTYPGTTRDVLLPILQSKGLKGGKDFFVAFSPERIDPGNERYTFARIPKIVGGLTPKATRLTRQLYAQVIDKVIAVSSAETAEVVKLLENTFRIVNIGLINEFAMLCDKLKIDVWEVVEAAKSKPFGYMPFYPGPGLGGHCIPADPLYLSWKARKVGFRTKMIDLAAKTNLFMPGYVVQRVELLLNEQGRNISKAKVLLAGVTYKKDVKDLRESPALDIIELLEKKRAAVSYSDPYIPYLDINSIHLKSTALTAATLGKSDLVILTADHAAFDYKLLAKHSKLILDTRNAFGARKIKAKHIVKL